MKVLRTAVAISLLFVLTAPAARRISFGRHPTGVSLRKRLHVNDLITEPGTAEIDFAGLYSWTSGLTTLPSALKYTPEGSSLFWGRTEYSVSFDSVASTVNTGTRSTQFSDHLSFAATSVLFDSQHFDIAWSTQVSPYLRGESGLRVGGTMIARYDGGGNSIGATAGWTAATIISDSNPAGVWDFGLGYGRKLGRFTPHANVLLEKSTGFQRTVAIFGGVEYQLTEHFAVDATGQRLGLNGIGPDRPVLIGVTWNLGKPTR